MNLYLCGTTKRESQRRGREGWRSSSKHGQPRCTIKAQSVFRQSAPHASTMPAAVNTSW